MRRAASDAMIPARSCGLTESEPVNRCRFLRARTTDLNWPWLASAWRYSPLPRETLVCGRLIRKRVCVDGFHDG